MQAQAIGSPAPSDVASRCMQRLAQIAAIRAGEQVVVVGDGMRNVTLRDVTLDAIVCLVDAAALPWIRAGLPGWRRALRPGGRVGFALFRSTSPTDPERCRDSFREAGFEDIEVRAHVEALPGEAPTPAGDAAPAPVTVVYAVAWNRPQ